MNKEFIPYEQALALKELGFDEPCFRIYCEKYTIDSKTGGDIKTGEFYLTTTPNIKRLRCNAPLYQQAFRWFREKHNLFHNIWNYTHGEPTDLVPNGFTFSIDEEWITIIGKKEDGYFEKYYTTYEAAEQACLDKLIEIVKNGKQYTTPHENT